VNVRGVRFYWAGAPARTIKGVLWSAAGAVLANASVVTAGAGIYQVVFGAPVACPIALNGSYKCSVWDTSATDYTRFASTPNTFPVPATTAFVNGSLMFRNCNAFAAGDANPTGSGVEFFAVEPLL
jgi:hypothetical protein